jgi:hypothetical protein
MIKGQDLLKKKTAKNTAREFGIFQDQGYKKISNSKALDRILQKNKQADDSVKKEKKRENSGYLGSNTKLVDSKARAIFQKRFRNKNINNTSKRSENQNSQNQISWKENILAKAPYSIEKQSTGKISFFDEESSLEAFFSNKFY